MHVEAKFPEQDGISDLVEGLIQSQKKLKNDLLPYHDKHILDSQ